MEVPAYVKANLAYWLEVEAYDPDRAGPAISEISRRWDI